MPQHEPRAARPQPVRPNRNAVTAVIVTILIGWSVGFGGARVTYAATSTFISNADALVTTSGATSNKGTQRTLQVRAPTPEYRVYMRFAVSGMTGTMTGARLRLFVTDASPVGGRFFAVTANWTETTVTWNNKPAMGAALGTIGAVTANTWAELVLPPASFPGNGTYSIGITTTNTNSVIFSSREGANPPQLVLTTATATPTPTPTPTAAPTPTATPTPTPTATPTPTPTPTPTATPTPTPTPNPDPDSDTHPDANAITHPDPDADTHPDPDPDPTPTPTPTPPPLTASFGFGQVPSSLDVQFTDTSSGAPTTWDWDYGDSSPHGTSANPLHGYATPGFYDVTLTVGDGVRPQVATTSTIEVLDAALATPTPTPTTTAEPTPTATPEPTPTPTPPVPTPTPTPNRPRLRPPRRRRHRRPGPTP